MFLWSVFRIEYKFIDNECFFIGYNLYNGDYRLWSRHVIPIFHLMYPDAEKAHIVAITAARLGLVPRLSEDKEIKPYLVGDHNHSPLTFEMRFFFTFLFFIENKTMGY